MKIRKILLSLLLTATAASGFGFCGFYVAKADAKLFNKTSQVILVRDGNKTTVTMSNDFQGDVKDFAMVVPVPSVLKREDIRVVPSALFGKLDAYSGPRLVEYYDTDPCYTAEDRIYSLMDMAPTMSVDNLSGATSSVSKDYKVKIEAQYQVEEYDVLILSAKESTGLKEWLIDNGYKIPQTADEVLEPYIKNNMKFFVVKVNAEKLDEMSGMGNVKKYIDGVGTDNVKNLRPLQITYESDKFMLPIRLGMANSNGEQDMIVYAFTKQGRVECTNYRTTKIPTNQEVPTFVREKFGKFYVDLFEKAHAKEDKEAIFLEYAWNVSPQFSGVKCDPCVGPPPIFSDFKQAGVDWAVNSNNQAANNVFFTRLHVRYSRETHPQDLLFQVTPNKEHFQGRYILHNTVQSDLKCDAGQEYCARVVKRRANELENLHALTSWNTTQYKEYVTEYYKKLDDPSLLYKVSEPEKHYSFPVFPVDGNDPNQGIKIGVLASVFGLMLLIVFFRMNRKEEYQFKTTTANA
ncbi:DUF2330 domain-containing protein [Paracrocinitomix mangrovi]|uniref:DUF2330 domain-containing protein n=1 Tax=Paracrocinitomix mangrovi TaxID=2862509 RepID=UPI001C8D24C4|nr:DUF2330 domain-containing protein [Paracrocinitomix mangrovi]UKN02349.1 DUF2330 domain-containing protein [Paracrocinitomix mangrovi]